MPILIASMHDPTGASAEKLCVTSVASSLWGANHVTEEMAVEGKRGSCFWVQGPRLACKVFWSGPPIVFAGGTAEGFELDGEIRCWYASMRIDVRDEFGGVCFTRKPGPVPYAVQLGCYGIYGSGSSRVGTSCILSGSKTGTGPRYCQGPRSELSWPSRCLPLFHDFWRSILTGACPDLPWNRFLHVLGQDVRRGWLHSTSMVPIERCDRLGPLSDRHEAVPASRLTSN